MTPRTWVLAGVFWGVLIFAIAAHCGCVSNRPPAVDIAAQVAEQQACVADNESRAAIDACRATARFRWCVKWPDEAQCPARGGGGQ